MSIYLIAALIVAVACALVAIGAANEPSRKVLIRVRLEVDSADNVGGTRNVTSMLPAAVADILLKRVQQGEDAEGGTFEAYQSQV